MQWLSLVNSVFVFRNAQENKEIEMATAAVKQSKKKTAEMAELQKQRESNNMMWDAIKLENEKNSNALKVI